jgi:Fe-S-cluster-containing dehydrogenase component
MIVTAFERLILLNSLPATGDILTIRAIGDLRSQLAFTDEEHETLQFKRVYKCSLCGERAEVPAMELKAPRCCDNPMGDIGKVEWLQDVEQEKEIAISEAGKTVIKSTLEQLHNEKKLTEQHLSLYDKFC